MNAPPFPGLLQPLLTTAFFCSCGRCNRKGNRGVGGLVQMAQMARPHVRVFEPSFRFWAIRVA